MQGNVAIRSYYKVSELLEDSLLNNNITKTVTIGDVSDVDLGKQTIFPLALDLLLYLRTWDEATTFDLRETTSLSWSG